MKNQTARIHCDRFGWGGSSERCGEFPETSTLHFHEFVRLATVRTFQLMKHAETGLQDPVTLLGYTDLTECAESCLIDVKLVAIPSPNEVSVVNPFEIFSDRASAPLQP